MKTSFFPLDNTTNQYVQITADCIRNAGYEVVDFPRSLKEINILDGVKLVNLNWYESADNPAKILVRILLLYFLKLRRIKIVFTCHNKRPHDCEHKWMSNLLLRVLCKTSDAIVGLCEETKQVVEDIGGKNVLSKYSTIPHVTYKGCYKEIEHDFRDDLDISKDSFVILTMGAVKRYKKIEALIQVMKERDENDCVLIIAGSCNDKSYLDELNRTISGSKNIKTIFRFIDDDEMYALIRTADLVAMAYDTTSSLNSGAAIAALGYGACICCPLIGMLKDMPNERFMWTYEYTDEKDRVKKFRDTIDKAYFDFKESPAKYRERGIEAEEYINKNHGRQVITELYSKLYSELIK